MSRYYYDLHIHSCLSPCADNDNTPHNLAGVGKLAGLQLMALTDHNTCRNCKAFFDAAAEMGIIPVAGMERTTAEDIHMVCLFPTLADALAFDEEIAARRVRIKNRPDIFGEQLLVDAADNILGFEEHLLSNATTVSLDESVPLAEKYHGVCYPAHIDREANGILAVLGMLPDTPRFSCIELHDGEKEQALRASMTLPQTVIVSSDAHYLWDVRDKAHTIALADGDPAKRLIERLREGDR